MKTLKCTGAFLMLASALILFSFGTRKDFTGLIESSIRFEKELDELPKRENRAFKEGEKLTYRLHYGIMNAGVAEMTVKPEIIDIRGRKVYHVVVNGYTKGAADWFFRVRDRYESYIDKDALVPWAFIRRVDEGGFKFSQDYIFNHYTKKVDVGGGEVYDIPAGIQDMVSSFYAARNLDFSQAKPGDIFSVKSFVDKEIWDLKIRFVGREIIDTDLGKVRALHFRPVVQKGRIFKSEEDLNVWISDDDNHIPLRAQANIIIGSVKMDLTKTENLANPMAFVN
ncbi:MAG: DUF3108 domain-containing protein [Bacteroidia bacterium]|nr:DUF3108 domain-containing protein [Bacteroidia bacterium]